jgi:hypothetical protein
MAARLRESRGCFSWSCLVGLGLGSQVIGLSLIGNHARSSRSQLLVRRELPGRHGGSFTGRQIRLCIRHRLSHHRAASLDRAPPCRPLPIPTCQPSYR